jgi:hypothetical protein
VFKVLHALTEPSRPQSYLILSMKIAILILAHKNVWQLQKLVERLAESFDIFIHADQKWDLDTTIFESYANVYFVNRHEVHWGSHLQIDATVELFTAAWKKQYDYYMLISGQDLPIKSNRAIMNFAAENREINFVNYESLPKEDWADQNGGFDRLDYYHGIHFEAKNLGMLKRKIYTALRKFHRLTGIKRKLYPVKYYGGWNWVNINKDAMNEIFRFLSVNPLFLKSFKYTVSGDEIWVQTILANSITNIESDSLRYTEWEEKTAHPNVLRMADLDRLMQAKDLFARKFDEKIDKEVIEKIYELTGGVH